MVRILQLSCKIHPKTQWVAAGVMTLVFQAVFVYSTPTDLRSRLSDNTSSLKPEVSNRSHHDGIHPKNQDTISNSILLTENKKHKGAQLAMNSSNSLKSLALISRLNQTEETLPELALANSRITCNKEEIDNLAEKIQEICSCISDIDNYVLKILSMEEVHVPQFNSAHGFTEIITHYNNHINVAKSHCYPWRHGISIVGSVKEMVVAAQEFAPKITHDFETTQELVANIINDHRDISETEFTLTELENYVKEVKETTKITNDSNALNNLKSVIISKEKEIQTIIKEKEVLEARHELEALINYLEGIRNAATNEKLKAVDIRNRIRNFREHIMRDATAFKKHRAYSQSGIKRLKRERESNNQELASIQRDTDKLKRWIGVERDQIAHLTGQIQDGQNELRILEHNIKNLKMKRSGRCLRVIPVPGLITRNQMIKEAKLKERARIEHKRKVMNERMKLVNNLQVEIVDGSKKIAYYQKRMSHHVSRSNQLEEELNYFSDFVLYLQNVEHEADLILPLLEKAINGISQMKDIFDAVKQDLEDVVEKAKKAKSEVEMHNIKYFVYAAINDLQCKWEQANEKIVLLGKCNKELN